MVESLVVFCIATVGSAVRWSADLALKRLAAKAAAETIPAGSKGDWFPTSSPVVDPVLRFGFILGCYGAIVLVLVSALPGALALERTGLAFALLCAGGIIGEIAGPGGESAARTTDAGDAEPVERPTTSPTLSVALAVMLNLGIAVLTTGQGLVEIIPPAVADYAPQLDAVIVVARRNGASDAPVRSGI